MHIVINPASRNRRSFKFGVSELIWWEYLAVNLIGLALVVLNTTDCDDELAFETFANSTFEVLEHD